MHTLGFFAHRFCGSQKVNIGNEIQSFSVSAGRESRNLRIFVKQKKTSTVHVIFPVE